MEPTPPETAVKTNDQNMTVPLMAALTAPINIVISSRYVTLAEHIDPPHPIDFISGIVARKP